MPLALLLVAAQLLRARDAVDPRTFTSPSGAFELHVDPSEVHGGGPGTYRMLHGGHLAWGGSRDFTLLDARVDEQGCTVGYALSEGNRSLGSLRVLVLDRAGEVLRDEPHARVHSGAHYLDPDPRPLDLFLFEDADLCVLRVGTPKVNWGREAWWAYRVSSGERVADFVPSQRLGFDDDPRWQIHNAQALPGPGLILATGFGWRSARLDEQWFALLEPTGKPVWSSFDRGAFAARVGELTGYDLVERVRQRGAVLRADPDGSFRLWRVAQHAAVDYRVEEDRTAQSWRVVETGRTELAGVPEAPAPPEPERVELAHVAAVALARAPADEGPELGPVEAWAFAAPGELCLVRRREGGGYEHLSLDSNGDVVGTTLFAALPPGVEGAVLWCRLAGGRWLLTVSPRADGVPAKAFFADAATGALQPLSDFVCPEVEAAAATPEGGFVVLATHSFPFTSKSVVIACGPDGRERWRITAPLLPERGDPASIEGARDLTVLPDGTVAVLNNFEDAIQLFDAGGTFRASADLTARWGAEPNYLVGIEPAPDGGLLVYDFNGTPPLRTVALDGSVRAELSPVRARGARYGPDGALWTSDGHRFFRLDGEGREAQALGAAPSSDVLHEAGPAAIDGLGRISIQDERNGVLHVWSIDGTKVLTAVPEPGEIGRVSSLGRIVAGPGGGFAVARQDRGHVLFDAAGARVGLLEDPRAVDFSIDGETSFAWSAQGDIELRAADAQVARVARLPSGRWITEPEDVCAFSDGSFAALADHEVGLYDAAGEPRASFRLPGELGVFGPSLGPSFLNTVSADRRWILVSGFGSEAWLIDRQGGVPRLFQAREVGQDAACEMALSPSGNEVLVLDPQALVLHRYALP